MFRNCAFIFSILMGFSAFAASGFVSATQGHQLYVETIAAKPGQPTVVLLNGLTYSLRQYDRITPFLTAQGIGVVRIDMFGMGQTLLKYAPMLKVISYKSQVADLAEVFRQLNLGRLNLVGLSYGGGIGIAYAAAFPSQINQLIVLAPYTEALGAQDSMIRSQVLAARVMFPLNPASDDELYDFYLRQNVYTTYPAAEPIVLENPYKLEAVFRLVQGIRKLRALDLVSSLPSRSVHLMIAGNDQYVPRPVLENFWNSLPGNTKQSVILVNGTEHKMPESIPQFTASWIGEIVRGNNKLRGGQFFQADPFSGKVTFPGGEMKLRGENERFSGAK
jgi:pimeloyl-ACP methyl ester carboxylesterase